MQRTAYQSKIPCVTRATQVPTTMVTTPNLYRNAACLGDARCDSPRTVQSHEDKVPLHSDFSQHRPACCSCETHARRRYLECLEIASRTKSFSRNSAPWRARRCLAALDSLMRQC